MAGLADVFSEQERTNWLKSCLAVNIAKYALENFVDREVKFMQSRIVQTVRSHLSLSDTTVCTSCSTANLIKCPTRGICKKRGILGCTSMHDSPLKQSRPCRIKKMCDEIRDEIIKEHRYGQPSWRNTSAEHWATNHWHIAKCFLPPDGYMGVGSAPETDFNGVLSVMLNCKHFDNMVSFTISQHGSSCLLSKTRDIGRAVRHNPNCKMKDSDLQDIFTTLIDLLSDPTCLAQDGYAQEAVIKLQQLRIDKLKITEAEMSQLLKNAHETLDEIKDVAESSMKEMKTLIQQGFQSCREQKEHEEEHAMRDFSKRLKKFYNENLRNVPLSPLFPSSDVSIDKFYATPDIYQIPKNAEKNINNAGPVHNYGNILEKDGKRNRNVFLQGEAGMGKSTFAAKMVLDWCSDAPNKDDDLFGDLDSLKVFMFVFFITLKEAGGECEITKMIKEQIIDVIYADIEREDAYILLNEIMQSQICLVIQDGLDEWTDKAGKLALPRLVLNHSECSLLITTRHWKMTDERIKESKIDCVFELKGVLYPYKLSKMVLGCLFPHRNVEDENERFRNDVEEKEIGDLFVVSHVDFVDCVLLG